MYRKIELEERMTRNEASEKYPDYLILIRWDSMDLSESIGTVVYIGDDEDELYRLKNQFDNPSLYGVSEGLNLQRSLGGIVVGT